MLTLREVGRHPQGASSLQELRNIYVITEAESGLVLTQKTGDLRLFLYNMEEVLLAARHILEARDGSASQAPGEQNHPQDAASDHDDLLAARRTIHELQKRITRLMAAGKAVAKERDQWKHRATTAAANTNDTHAAASDGADKRYATLRRFLARQFHPDHAPGNGIEKIIRSEVFKEVWAEIDRIDALHR